MQTDSPSVSTLKPRFVETKDGGYSFYSEGDADLDSIDGRIEYFCAQFEVEPPEILYEDGGVLMTDDFLTWCEFEGASIDWIAAGHITAPLKLYREKHKKPETERALVNAFSKLDDAAKAIFLAGLSRIAEGGEDSDTVLQEVREELEIYNKKRNAF